MKIKAFAASSLNVRLDEYDLVYDSVYDLMQIICTIRIAALYLYNIAN
jgi:hypothetical protein